MLTGNYFQENPEIKFYFDKIIDFESIIPLKEKNFEDANEYQKSQNPLFEFAPSNTQEAKEGYSDILEVFGEYMGNEIAPIRKDLEKEGLKVADGHVVFPKIMEEKLALFRDAGVVGYAIERKFGGLQVPRIVEAMINEIMARAEPSFGIMMGCYNLGEVICMFADDKMKQEAVPTMSTGAVIGSMSLTEPNYGSNLPEIKTKATQDANGNWFITGSKQFITHGKGVGKDIPAKVLTLARSGTASGAKALSFFLVDSKDIELVRIEEKLGLHLSPTCQIAYDNSPAQLIGQEGFGLVKYAMAMMNGARLGIAGQALGIAEAAYQESKKYASERVQFNKLIQEIPAVKRMLDRMKMETRAIRALVYRTAEFVDLYDGYKEKLHLEGLQERDIRKDPNVIKFDKLAKMLTPIAKYYAAETCISLASDAIQVYGGAGYTEEYDVAQIYRDARITSIYEGTTQLQIVAAIGGVVEGMSETGSFRKYIQEIEQKLSPEASFAELKEIFANLAQAVDIYKSLDRENKEYHAFEVVEIATHVITSYLLCEVVNYAPDSEKDDRLQTAKQFVKKSKSVAAAALLRFP